MVGGDRCAYHAKVFWEETYATVGKSEVPNDMWAKRPRGQLDKCVEAAALRKAFPEELGNTYAAEEMEGRTIEGVATEHAPTPPVPPKPPAPPTIGNAEVIDSDTGEVIDDRQIVRETGEDTGAVVDGEASDWPEDPDGFLKALQAALGPAKSLADVDEVWTESDAIARLTHVPAKQAIAKSFYRDAINRVNGRG
jgi:hypothetical protein